MTDPVVHVLSAGACKGVVEALAEQYMLETGAEISASFGAVGAMRDKLLAREPCDLLILTAAMLHELAQTGHVWPETIVPLGMVRTGVAVRVGTRAPDITTRETLRQSLLAASAIYVPDTRRSTAGVHVAKMLRSLDLDTAVESRLREFPNGATAMKEMVRADERNAIGCTQVTEINYTPGVKLVGVLPAEFELATLYAMAVCAKGEQPELAQALAELLTSRVAEDIRIEGGFEL